MSPPVAAPSLRSEDAKFASLFEALFAARRALQALFEEACRALEAGRPLAECQDPVEDVVAALERALRQLAEAAS